MRTLRLNAMTYSMALLFSVAMLFAASANAQAPFDAADGMLVNDSGMTVYTFDKDVANSGASSCDDACAKNWPPVEAGADATPEGDYTVIERDDGTKQWAHQGQPLYTYTKDAKTGDSTGDNVGGVWHVVKQ